MTMLDLARDLRRLYRAIAALCLFTGSVRATLISVYEFNGNFNDSLGNGDAARGNDGPLVVNNPGVTSFSSGQWSWTSPGVGGTGLILDAAPALAGNYSIGIRFKFQTIDGYRKLVDFQDAGSDFGLYVLNGTLNFYPVASDQATTIAADSFVDVLLTRAGSTGGVTGYINGSPTAQWRFTDSDSYAVAGLVGDAARFRFFEDDKQTLGEWSNGAVSEIRLWDTALSASEVPDAFAAIPEPVSSGYLAAALAGSFLRRKRRSF
ncbi:MAG: hypothetical protein ACR2OZ_01615 [Verrucomicrobiales bacterium]